MNTPKAIMVAALIGLTACGTTGNERRENHPDKHNKRRYARLMRHALFFACIALAACANPAVDTAAPNFSETQYAADFGECWGDTALDAALRGLGEGVVGSLYGAARGAQFGGASKEGAIIGVVAGSVVGFAVGSYRGYTPFKQQGKEVGRCLTGKGYTLQL